MKLIKLIKMICLGCVLTGCMGIGDDLSKCVWDENTTLLFLYRDDAGIDLFPQTIKSVDAFIYDHNDCLVDYRRFAKADLDAFAGWKLTLPAGEYRAVCWGNMGANSRYCNLVCGTTTLEQCYAEIAPAATATGDPVYYSPYKKHPASRSASAFAAAATRGEDTDYTLYAFSVPAGESVVREMHFACANRTVNIYVQGLSYEVTVEISQLWSQYDFFLNTGTQRRDFLQPTHGVTTADGPAQLATFHSAFGEVTDDMVIVIRKVSDGSLVETINLRDFLLANPAADKNVIDILIKFNDMGVTIAIPGWGGTIVTPGID